MLLVSPDATAPSRVVHTKIVVSIVGDCKARLRHYLTVSANSYCTTIEGDWVGCSKEGRAGDNRAPGRGAKGEIGH